MKKLLICCLLTGCANVNFDGGEYDRFVTVKAMTDKAIKNCDNEQILDNLNQIDNTLLHQMIYAKYKRGSSQVYKSTVKLSDILVNLHAKAVNKTLTPTYCKLKLDNLSDGTVRILKSLGDY